MHKYAPVSDRHTVNTSTRQRVSIRARLDNVTSAETLIREGICITPEQIETAQVVTTVTETIRRVVEIPNVE